jgi:xylan 1,4-beta-xylosidase
MHSAAALAAVLILSAKGAAATDDSAFPVTIRVDAGKDVATIPQAWRFFGYDEPNYTYMKDGRQLLSELSALSPQTVYVRTHNLLTSGDGTPALKWGSTNAYTEDAAGNPRYDWTIIDKIFDTYRERGMRPYVQVGFMPEALSTHPLPYRHNWMPKGGGPLSTGWAYPPKDYAKWAELVFQWVRHSVDRYSKAEVERWYWELWNEPNIFYWRGSPAEYQKLYDYTADAVKRALPTARVGGPHIAGPKTSPAAKFLREFLEHCLRGTNHATGKTGAPIDFIAFHAKGDPRFTQGHVRMGIASQLLDIDRGFAIVATYPEFKNTPVVIGESDPDGCAACPASVYPQNGYRNGTLYASYTAATFARKYALAETHGVNLEGAVTWAFEFEDQPYFAGFRVLSTNGIALPVLNVFRMFGLMGTHRLATESTHDPGLAAITKSGVRGQPDVSALATRDETGGVAVLLWHYHDDDVSGRDADVTIELSKLATDGRPRLLEHFRVDRVHGNAFEAWKAMGSPQQPTPDQLAALRRASQLAFYDPPRWLGQKDGALTLHTTLPRQGVSLMILRP